MLLRTSCNCDRHGSGGLLGKYDPMNNLLYLLAVVLIIGWALGFFVYSASGLIHILLVIAVIAIILRLIRGVK